MLLNYLKIAWRNLARQKGYAFINIAGLAIGLAACILILLYVVDELGYDRYHDDADRIYRITHQELDLNGTPTLHRVLIDPPIAPLLAEEMPEIEVSARLTPVGPLLGYEDRYIQPENTYWSDPGILQILRIPFVAGEPEGALIEPFSLLLSQTQAHILFGAEDPIGKTVVVNGDESFTVRGVFADLPSNTHLKIDALGSLSTMNAWFGELGWDSPNYATYVRLARGASENAVEEKLADLLARHRPASTTGSTNLLLQPVTDIHLRSQLVGEIGENGDIRYVYLLSAVAIFILLIACFNFINLSTAKSARRAREVGMRKVLGANRRELVQQFLGESMLLVAIGIILATLLVEAVLPAFNGFTGKDLSVRGFGLGPFVALLAGIALFTGVAAGAYPAAYLSSFRPAVVLRRRMEANRGGGLRSALVVAQFVVAIVLLNATLVVYRQLDYVKNQRLGFDEEQILVLATLWDEKENFEPIRQQILQNPNVVDVAQSSIFPSRRLSFSSAFRLTDPERQIATDAELYPISIDPHFLSTYGIELAAGRNLSEDSATDAERGFILNETAARQVGWADPGEAVGASVRIGDWGGEVIGVVRDFHLESLHQKIAPMIFYSLPRNFRVVSLKVRAQAALPEVMAFLEAKWQQYEPNAPVTISFLDQRLDAVYENERRLGKIFVVFTGLAILITCLGLFGMATFAVERRTKEIGIRKTLGASAGEVVVLFSRNFMKLVLIAAAIGTPLALLLADRWLETFAYSPGVPWWLFVSASAAALAIAALTVGYQSARAAMSDPVKSLRYE